MLAIKSNEDIRVCVCGEKEAVYVCVCGGDLWQAMPGSRKIYGPQAEYDGSAWTGQDGG